MTIVVAVVRSVQCSPRFVSIVDLRCSSPSPARFPCTAVLRQDTTENGVPRISLLRHCRHRDRVLLHCSPTQCFDRPGIGTSRVRSDLESSLWPVLVLTSERRSLANGPSVHVQLRLAVLCPAKLSLFAPDAPSAHPYQLSSELQTSLRLKCCLVTNSTPFAPLPRFSVNIGALPIVRVSTSGAVAAFGVL